jgi:3-dehydroquinate dehydratase-2
MNILVLNGPNLNLLGEREPHVYGHRTLQEINDNLSEIAKGNGAELHFFQSNHEGELIDKIHAERKWMDALIFNPGAFTHYSYALRDAVASVQKPMIEVHLSNPMLREAFRHVSVFEGLPNVERILGKGAAGYTEALERLIQR